jgi:hypothetical protein
MEEEGQLLIVVSLVCFCVLKKLSQQICSPRHHYDHQIITEEEGKRKTSRSRAGRQAGKEVSERGRWEIGWATKKHKSKVLKGK